MTRIFIGSLILLLSAMMCFAAGQISTATGTGAIHTKVGTGMISVSTYTITAAGTAGQCMGLLCAITKPN